MNKPKSGNNTFFLLSFIPAVAYWYLEANYSIKIALIGGVILSVLEISLEKILLKHVHQISKLNFALIVFLGGFSLIGEDGIWFKLQPTISMWAVVGYMIYKKRKDGEGLFTEMLKSMNTEAKLPPKEIFESMEKNLVFLFILYGAVLGALALWAPTSYWAFGKGIGLFVVIFIFFIIQMIVNRKIINNLNKN